MVERSVRIREAEGSNPFGSTIPFWRFFNMSIEDTFDCLGKEIISAKDIVKKIDNFPKTMIVFFLINFSISFWKNIKLKT